MIELTQLKQLVTIAKCKTIVAASEELAISQSALCRSLKRLEDDLQAKLFERKKQRLIINELGEIAVNYAQKILSTTEEMQGAIAKAHKCKSVILLGSITNAPVWFLQNNSQKEFEERTIEAEIEAESIILKDFENGKYEYIVLNYSVEDSNNPDHTKKFISKKICEENLFFSLPKKHRYAKRKSLSFADMDGEIFIVADGIGHWDEIHRKNLPHSKFLIQHSHIEEIIKNSNLPHFVSDLSIQFLNRPIQNKSVIPISDKDAHAEYYLWKKI